MIDFCGGGGFIGIYEQLVGEDCYQIGFIPLKRALGFSIYNLGAKSLFYCRLFNEAG